MTNERDCGKVESNHWKESRISTQCDDVPLRDLTAVEREAPAPRPLECVHADADSAPFPPEQLREINRRLVAADAGELVGEPWPEVYRELAASSELPQ